MAAHNDCQPQSTITKSVEDDPVEMDIDIVPETADSNPSIEEDIEDGEVDDLKDWDGKRVRLQTSDKTSSDQDTSTLVVKEKRYPNKAGSGFVTGVDVFSEEEQAKLSKRANRFNLDPTKMKPLTEQELSKLYSSVGVKVGDESNRLQALHMRGLQDMSTEDIFAYFKAYGPASIEWINDFSCNVLWLDEVSAARALIGLSQVNDNDTEVSVAQDESSDEFPGKWRVGMEHAKAKSIRLRFATTADKKPPRAEKSSDYYKKHGNPNFGGIKGILTESHKRRYRRDDTRGSESRGKVSPEPREPQSRSRLPRMRMYADDEEVKIEKRKAQQADLRSRLQRERNEVDSDSDEEEPVKRKRFAGDLRSKLNSKQKKLGIELDHEQYYELIASE